MIGFECLVDGGSGEFSTMILFLSLFFVELFTLLATLACDVHFLNLLAVYVKM